MFAHAVRSRLAHGNTDVKAIAAATVTVILWASAFVAIRSAGHHYSPGALAEGRMVTAALVLLAIWAMRRQGLPTRAAWPGILTSGILWFGMYMVALNWGEQEVDAGTAALLVNIGPILMAILAALLLREGMHKSLVCGIAVAFAGAAIVAVSTSNSHQASLLGVILCIVAAVCYAIGVVSQKPALAHTSALQATTFGATIGAIACLPFTGQLFSQIQQAPAGATMNLVYLGIFPTAIAFSTWAYALSRTTAGRMGSTTYAVPAVVVVMSWLILGEVPTLVACIGGLLCLIGVAISRLRSKPQATPTAAPTVASPTSGITD